MNQTALFDGEQLPPASRSSDPSTSHSAEQRVTRSGARKSQAQMVLEAVIAYPSRTAAELSTTLPLDHVQTQRRLSDLKTIRKVVTGPKRVCGVNKTDAVTWHVTNRS